MPPNIPLSSNVVSYIEQTTKPRSTSPVAWWVLAGTASTLIVQGGGSRVGLLFHNPGTINLFFVPGLVDGNGNSLTPGANSGAGSFLVSPGAYLYIGQESPIGSAIYVAAQSGTGNPATVWEFI